MGTAGAYVGPTEIQILRVFKISGFTKISGLEKFLRGRISIFSAVQIIAKLSHMAEEHPATTKWEEQGPNREMTRASPRGAGMPAHFQTMTSLPHTRSHVFA